MWVDLGLSHSGRVLCCQTPKGASSAVEAAASRGKKSGKRLGIWSREREFPSVSGDTSYPPSSKEQA